MFRNSVLTLVLVSFVAGQLWADPAGPTLPPVTPMPLPTTPSPPSNNQPGLPTNPLNPGAPIGRGGNPSWPIGPGGTTNPVSPINPNPGWPTTPYPTNPSAPYPTYPGGGVINLNYSCPLVDQETHTDLLAALDVLERAIQVVPECRNDANLMNSMQNQEKMRKAAIELQRIWNDQDHLNENLVSFDAQLQVMVMGINSLSDTLNNNSLINSRCGQEMMTTGGALLAFSDLVSGVAPYALFAAAAAKSMSVAVPYVLGVVGLSSVLKIIAQLSSNKGPNNQPLLDMNIPAHQQTVLKATCEFSRIATKIRYLKLAQSGQIEMLSREINQLNENIYYNEQSLGASLDDILNGRKEFYKKIDKIRAQMYNDIRSHNELRKYLGRVMDDSMACSLGMEIIENHKQGKFPVTIDQNFKALLEVAIPYNELSLKATSRQYAVAIAELESNVVNSGGYRMGYCGQTTQRFVNTLERILQTIEEQLIAQEQLYEKQLSENPLYRNWYNRTSVLEKDRETLDRVVKTMSKGSQDSSIMSKSALDQRMESLRNALFGSKSRLPFTLKKSPIENWLNYTFDMHARTISLFNQSLSSMMDEVSAMRIKKYKKKTHYDETVSILPETFLREWFLLDTRYENFKFINATNFPVGSEQQVQMCNRLEENWFNWDSAMLQILATKHVCDYISKFIDSKTSTGVVDICGRTKLDGSADQDSLIAKTERKLSERGYKKLAVAISEKMNELKCVGR